MDLPQPAFIGSSQKLLTSAQILKIPSKAGLCQFHFYSLGFDMEVEKNPFCGTPLSQRP
jgi:hypothetical protein